MKIRQIKAFRILNSRKEPAIAVIVNKKYVASAPSGASTGSNEVRAFAKNIDYCIKEINNADFQGKEFNTFEDLSFFDDLIPQLGGNPVIALQFAVLKAMADNNVWHFLNPDAKKLPIPVGNVIGGGKHTKEISTDIQEFLLLPQSDSFNSNDFVSTQIHKKIGKELKLKSMTDEGAWIPRMSNIEVLEFLSKFVEDEKNNMGIPVKIGIDIAATSFFNGKYYAYRNFSKDEKEKKLLPEEQVEFVNSLITDYGLAYVEDPLEENDFNGFAKITKKTLVCGDDLIVTNIERLKKAIRQNSVNCIIIKPNQIGSIVKTKEVVELAKQNDVKTIISHRSGETMDATISHLAVAWGIPFIKCGIYGKERRAKLDELAFIETQME